MNRLNSRLLVLATFLLIFSAALVSYLAVERFQQSLEPEMAQKAATVGESIKSLILKVEKYGIPINKMTGVENYFETVQNANPEILYIGMTDRNGKLLSQVGKTDDELPHWIKTSATRTIATGQIVGQMLVTVIPLKQEGVMIGYLYLGQDASFVPQKMKEISYDVLTVLVVSALVALELLRFVMAFSITTPLGLIRQMIELVKAGDFSSSMPRDVFGGLGRLNVKFNQVLELVNKAYHSLHHPPPDLASKYRFSTPGTQRILPSAVVDYIRWPFFLLIFSDSLSLSFFPVYVDTLYTPSIGLSRSLASSLPISIFMLVWAVSMPWAGGWIEKVGFRRAFIVGAGLTTLGLLLTGGAQSIYDLLLWRSITAVGYGIVFITAQSYIAKYTPPAQRTKGMATFLGTFFSGSLSGAAIGGILSDRIGFQMTFFLSASLSLAAALFVYRFLNEDREVQALKKKLSISDFKTLLSNRRFATITFLAAVPAKLALAGFLYYSAPLYMESLGSSQSTTGRIMMAYGLAIVLLSPTIARMVDKLGLHKKFVSIGGYASAAAMFLIYFMDDIRGMMLSITLLGVAHAIGVSPQLALVNDFCKDVVKEIGATTATGIFRLLERIGNVSGPLIAASLIASSGFKGAFLAIGIICLASITAFTIALHWFDRQDRLRSQPISGNQR